MDRQPDSSGNRAFSRNLAIMSCLLFGKVTLSLLLKLFISGFMIVELLSLAAMAVALSVLLALGTFSLGKEEQRAEDGEGGSSEVLSFLKASLIPLAGLALCESTQGMGWSAVWLSVYSSVIQTQESFSFVICGIVLCAAGLLVLRMRIKNIVNFRYFTILASLLLLVIPWMCADFSGSALVLVTALPWGFSSAALAVVLLVDLVNLPRSAIVPSALAIAFCIVGGIAIGAIGVYVLGYEMTEILWRVLLVLLIAVAALEILREYRLVERELERLSQVNGPLAPERFGLTAREQEILAMLLQGRSPQWIGQKCYISENTVRSHIKHIYQKCDVHSRDELIDLIQKL